MLFLGNILCQRNTNIRGVSRNWIDFRFLLEEILHNALKICGMYGGVDEYGRFVHNMNVIQSAPNRISYKIDPLYSGVCYNEQMLKRTVFIGEIRLLQRTKML
jgi:hypothetical protein